MYLRVSNAQYNLAEFDLFVTEVNGNYISVIEMLVKCSIKEFDEERLKEKFSVDIGRSTYTFSNFAINEIYKENDLVKVICVK